MQNKQVIFFLVIILLGVFTSGCCGSGQKMCGLTCFYPDRQCCHSNILFNNLGDCEGNCYNITSESCCKGKIYSKQTDSCCNGTILNGTGWADCNGRCYQNQVCCNNTPCRPGYGCCDVTSAQGPSPTCYNPDTSTCVRIY